MLETILISVLIVAICVVLLMVQILLKKKGKFPHTHVSGNRALRKQGIHCVQAQDREARLKRTWNVAERHTRPAEEIK